MSAQRLYLIDGSGYIFRAFYGIPMMTKSDGAPVNAIYGFSSMLGSLLERIGCNPIAVVFDKGRRTFRNDIYPDYKANRSEAPEELVSQFPGFRAAVQAFNVAILEQDGFEADDVIATYVKKAIEAGLDVTIVSSDKDLMQLVCDHVEILDPMKNKIIRHEQVLEKFGVLPHKVVDVQALAGDSSDNIPGIKGIGPKTAAELIQEYGDLEGLLQNAHLIPQAKRRERVMEGAESARLSKKLVELCPHVPLDIALEALNHKPYVEEALQAFFEAYEFERLKARYISKKDLLPSPPKGDDKSTCYKCIETLQDLDRVIARIRDVGVFALDILWHKPSLEKEAGGLFSPKKESHTYGIALFVAGDSYFIPCDAAWADKVSFVERDVWERLVKILSDISLHKIVYDLKTLIFMLVRHGIAHDILHADDIILMHFVVLGSHEKHDLEVLAQNYVSAYIPRLADVVGSGKKALAITDPSVFEDVVTMMHKRVSVLPYLYDIFRQKLTRYHLTHVYESMDKPLAVVLAHMQHKGIALDHISLKEIGASFAEHMARLQQDVYDVAGESFNISSPKQVADVLFGKLGLEGGKKTKTGAFSTDADVLESLAHHHKVVRDILDYRMYGKLLSTYVQGLLEAVDMKTGRVHTRYDAVTATTGRLSSLEPNLQNIPIKTDEGKRVRKAFVASPDHVLVSLDYSQIELRILAHMADIPLLKEALIGGEDIHALTASQVFDVPLSEVTPLLRGRAKAVNFGIIYGISAFGLAAQLGVSRTEAKTFMDRYFEKFPEIVHFMEKCKDFCRQHGYVETAFKRRVYLPGIHDKNFAVKGYAERQAINAPIQGTAADIMRRAMIRVHDCIEKKFPDIALLLQVHDELILEVPRHKLEDFVREACVLLETAADPFYHLEVPLIVNVGYAHNWCDAH